MLVDLHLELAVQTPPPCLLPSPRFSVRYLSQSPIKEVARLIIILLMLLYGHQCEVARLLLVK